MEKIKSKKAKTYAVIILLATSMTVALLGEKVQAQVTNSTLVSTELINYYSMTSSEVQTFLQLIKDQGIPMIIIRLNAMNEFQSGTSPGIAKAKEIINKANEMGIEVSVDLHTWYTTWDNYFRDSASGFSTNRQQYITYVQNVLADFSTSNLSAFMVLNEPQARKATSSENQFILDIINAAKQVTNKPISVRFMGGYSPSTGYYSPQIDAATDFLCRNTYWDPRSPSKSVYGVSEDKIKSAIDAAHNQGKQLWITEFGKTKNDLEEQRSYVEAFVAYAKNAGIDAIFCWVSQPESGTSETYNIFNGYTPNPAFYELKNDGTPKPMPTPTPTPTPPPTPVTPPTPTSTPKTTPSPTKTPGHTPTLTPTPTPERRASSSVAVSGLIQH